MRKNMMKKFLVGLGMAVTMGANAQVYTMADGSVTACGGAFVDSGGEGAGGYQNNENFTTTICPDGSGGPAISLQFITFTLSTAGSEPGDVLFIHDGPDISYPLLGQWSGTDSPGIVSASFTNPTGCLTLVFISNETGTGVFSSLLTCFQPCQPPLAEATVGEAIPAMICQNEMITFNASASSAAPGFTIVEYAWDFDDGTTDNTTGSIVEHSFPTPGEYVVQVTVTDDNGCQSTNLVDLQLLVSTTPIFAGTTPSTVICQGDVVNLTGVATPVTWSAIPEANFGDGIYLPDEQGIPFNSTLTFEGFSPGATLTNIADLPSVCVSMEHSFMGDLVVYLTCPNGQSVTFHQQGGGGTFIGGALDGETVPPSPGECWEYCFSPFATNGTWAENAAGTIPAGTYESVQPMDQLVGCPLNGVWTFTVVDQWSIDDGFLCSWELNFNPDLYPDLTEFTPVLGLSSLDSTYWTGTGFVPGSTPATGVAAPSEPGVYPYVFTVTDNFGCAYDTTITITVNPSPQAPILITGDNLICEDGIAYLNAPAGFDTYLWSPDGAIGQNVNVGAGTYTVTVAYGDCPLTSDPFTVNMAPNPVPVITGLDFSCGGIPVQLSTTETYPSYLWSTNATSASIDATTGTYTVTVTSADGCTGTSDPFSVVVANDPTAAFVYDPLTPVPVGTTVGFNGGSSNGNGSAIDTWSWELGDDGATASGETTAYTYDVPGTYQITLTVTNAEGCTDLVTTIITVFPPEIDNPNVFTPNGDGNNETFDITNIEFWNNTVKIYNRWGQVVYEAKNYRSQWKGKDTSGNDLSDGTYYYEVVLSNDKAYTGHVTLLR
jgi:gliding motility-associated-like protein